MVCGMAAAAIYAAEPPPEAKTPGQGKKKGIGRVELADAAKIERDVTYGRGGDVDLKMDIYYPKNPSSTPLPVVMYVHGGAWQAGDKAGGAGMPAVPELLKRGFLVTSINYRLAPQYKFPAQIEDCKCAVRFLRAKAAKYNLDPKRIGIWGGSAGGHLVALMGLAGPDAGLEGKGGWQDQSSSVQAVVDLFGPADLTMRVGKNGRSDMPSKVFGATSDDDPVLKKASPVTYITKDAPPFLILHGDKDTTVPLVQSEELQKRLKAAGVSTKLVVVKNAGHGFAPVDGEPNPSREELAKMTAEFFVEKLPAGK